MTRSLSFTCRALAVIVLLTAYSADVFSAEKPISDVVLGDPKDWPMFNHDPQGTRHNFAETLLDRTTVRDLAVVWRHDTRGAVAGTPAVVNDVVYAGDAAGWVYALKRDGELLWETRLPGVDTIIWGSKLSASALVTNRTLVIPDLGGSIHGLDVETGAVRWTTRPPSPGPVFGDQFPYQAIFGSATMVGKNVAIGISSLEEGAVLTPNYPCCTFRGSLVLLDPADGSIIWQTFMTELPKPGETDGNPDTIDFGPSGATIWSTPTYDRATKTIYAATGNNYSKPTTGTSDAIVAFDAADGHIKWVSQKTEDDFWNLRFPPQNVGDPPDFDFGDSPQIYKIRGRTVVGIGQKSGFYHVVDAGTGERINEFQGSNGGNLGGLFADSAFADGVAFTNGSIWPDPFGSPDPPVAGVISAIDGDASAELWRFETPGSANLSGLAVAGGVLYFQSTNGTLYALDVSNGIVLASVDVNLCHGSSSPRCGQTSGPAVSRGQVYVGTGDMLSFIFDVFRPFTPGAIVALSIGP